MSRVLVYQANGVQGATTLRRVQQAGYETRALIRNRSSAEGFVRRGIEVAVADLTDREALVRAHESVDFVVLQIPAHADSFVARAIDNAAFAMESMRVKGATIKMANPTPAQAVPDSGFSANSIILKRMQSSVIPFSVVEPTMYLDTFLKPNLRDEISRQNVIDLPLAGTLRVAWTTVDDAARMAVRLLGAESHGQVRRCAGEIACTGHGLARAFSAVLGREIRYKSTAVDVFQREIESAIGAVAAAPAVSKFRFLSSFPDEAARLFGCNADPVDIPGGFEPTTAEEWITSNRASFCA